MAALSGLPHEPPYASCAPDVAAASQEVEETRASRSYTGTTIEGISGQPGQFDVTLRTERQARRDASGRAPSSRPPAGPYDAKAGPPGLRRVPGRHHQRGARRSCRRGELIRPVRRRAAERIAFIQCAGSRDTEHLPYCSSVLLPGDPQAGRSDHAERTPRPRPRPYKDMRTPGQYEGFYRSGPGATRDLLTKAEVEGVEGRTASGGRPRRTRCSATTRAWRPTWWSSPWAWSPTPPTARPSGAARRRKRVEKGESETQMEEAGRRSSELGAPRGQRDPEPRLPPGSGPAGAALRLPRLPLHLLPLRDPAHGHLRRRRVRAPMDAARPRRTAGARR